jgi:hypothetical protein
MQTTGRGTGEPARRGSDEPGWQAPLEVDPADAGEQARDLLDDDTDPEAPAAAPTRVVDSDLLGAASEADLAEQLSEVAFDDDGDR